MNSGRIADEAILVRGGTMARSDMEASAQVHYERFSEYALSFWSVEGQDADSIAREVGTDRLPHRRLRSASVEAVRQLGYEVEWSGQERHVSVTFPEKPTEEDWDNLDAVFSDPQPNPVAR